MTGDSADEGDPPEANLDSNPDVPPGNRKKAKCCRAIKISITVALMAMSLSTLTISILAYKTLSKNQYASMQFIDNWH